MNDRTPADAAPVDIVDYLLFIPFVAAFFTTLVAFDLIQRAAIMHSRAAHEKSVSLLNRTLCTLLKFVGVEIVVHRNTDLAPGIPHIVVSNHQSLFDVPILHTIFAANRPRFIAKKELSRGIPSVSFNLRRGQNAVIDRSNPRQAIPEIEKLAELMTENGFASVIFPEGTRARTGELKRFLYTGFATLLRHAPTAGLVPVAIDGSWKLAVRRRGPLSRRTQIRVVVGETLPRRADENPKELMNDLYQCVSDSLTALREGRFGGDFKRLV